MAQGLRTSAGAIPVSNEELYTLTAKVTKTRRSTVAEIIKFVGSFTAGTIRSGTMQTVMIPYFGKIKPKKTRVMAAAQYKAQRPNGANTIAAAIAGKTLKDTNTTGGPEEGEQE